MGEYTNKTKIQRFLWYADTLLLFLCVHWRLYINMAIILYVLSGNFYLFQKNLCKYWENTWFLVTKVAKCISEQTVSNGRMNSTIFFLRVFTTSQASASIVSQRPVSSHQVYHTKQCVRQWYFWPSFFIW